MKWIKSKKFLWGIMIGTAVFMLILNCLTPLWVDDYAYCFSWATGERILNFFDIFPSMYAHAFSMNGRLLCHFFVQLFLLLPKWIFSIVNTLIFSLQLWFMYRIVCYHRQDNALLYGILAAMVWCFVPVFGQVNLWLDGSCNYLWGITGVLAYCFPYFQIAEGKEIHKTRQQTIGFTILGVIIGSYQENQSLAAIFCIGLFLFMIKFLFLKPLPFWAVSGFLGVIVGLVFLFLTPATLSRYGEDIGVHLSQYLQHFFNTLDLFVSHLLGLTVFWYLLFLAAFCQKANQLRMINSAIFVITGIFTHFSMIAAPYYPKRCILPAAIFLIIGCAILMQELLTTPIRHLISRAAALLFLFTTLQIIRGGHDVVKCYEKATVRIASIQEQKQQGKQEIQISPIWPGTPYTAVYGLKDLDMKDPSSWPNNSMAHYYGVTKIKGIH